MAEWIALYTVTTMVDKWYEKPTGRRRTEPGTVACCLSLEDARRVLEENVFDVHELDQDYAVIELTSSDSVQGVGPTNPDPQHPERRAHEQWWYRWEGAPDRGRYVSCAQPEAGLRVVAWAGF